MQWWLCGEADNVLCYDLAALRSQACSLWSHVLHAVLEMPFSITLLDCLSSNEASRLTFWLSLGYIRHQGVMRLVHQHPDDFRTLIFATSTNANRSVNHCKQGDTVSLSSTKTPIHCTCKFSNLQTLKWSNFMPTCATQTEQCFTLKLCTRKSVWNA